MSDLAADPILIAKEQGLVVVEPEDNQLLIDIDNGADEAIYREMLEVLENNGIDYAEEKRTVSRGGNTHIYGRILIEGFKDDAAIEVDPLLRVALQACLGSDRKRELLSLLRIVLKLQRTPTLFFETKEAA